jgi:bacteriorhodopsin
MGIRKLTFVLLGCVMAAMLGFGVFILIRSQRRPPDPTTPVLAAQYFVKGNMGPGVILHFSPLDWTKVERKEDTVTVSGSVQAVPKNGGPPVSFAYECVVTDTDTSWQLVKLNMLQQ